mmetsp:Transcript_64036/g.111573  ORF Transcript_64036/g.111573 Transcript_64036/m.111573 type:complete len:84 (-) Transcript_64036:9-260(-)
MANAKFAVLGTIVRSGPCVFESLVQFLQAEVLLGIPGLQLLRQTCSPASALQVVTIPWRNWVHEPAADAECRGSSALQVEQTT